MPFSLLDSINAHRASKGRSTVSSSSTRPGSAYGRREKRVPEYDVLVLEDDADTASAAIEPTQRSHQTWKVRERQRHDREEELVKYEERKESDDSRTNIIAHTSPPIPTSVSASTSASIAGVATSSANRVPASIAALSTYTPQSFEHSPALQHSIQLLHAAPLLASFLPSLASLDTAWSSLIASHSLYRQSESRHMAALREEELRIRDATLTFMRVSMEYRRTETHDATDGRIVQQNDKSDASLSEGEQDAWLVRDDGQRTTIEVDWNGRYWQSERRREKEAWYRTEERELQSLYEHGVQLVTRLYRHKFEQLMRLAADQRVTARVDPQTQQLNTQVHETLTALRLQSTTTTTTTPSSASPSASGSALLPPRHPSLSAYAGRLYSSLHDLSTLLSSHYQQVVQVLEHSHTLTSASASIEQLVRSLHEEERERREEVEQLKQDKRQLRDEQKSREAEWEEKLRLERLEVWKEREQRHRVETQMAELQDTLSRIQVKYDANRKRRLDVADKETQCEALEAAVSDKSSEVEAKEAEDESKMAAIRKLAAVRAKTKSSGGARLSGKHNFQLSLTTPTSSSTGSDRLSPRSATSPRSSNTSTPPPVSPSNRSPRGGGSSVFSFGAAPGSSSGSTSSPASSTMKGTADGSGKVMRPALRGGAIADGGARHSKTASTASAASAEQSSNGKEPTVLSADKQRWDGVPFV